MQEAPSCQASQHVAVLAFPVFSHAFPLFNLTCKLARESPEVRFSFFSTAKANFSTLSNNTDPIPSNVNTFNLKVPGEELCVSIKAFPGSFKLGMELAVKETAKDVSFLLTDCIFSFAVDEFAEEMKLPWAAFYVSLPFNFAVHLHANVIQKQYMQIAGPTGEVDPEHHLEGFPGSSSLIKIRDLPQEIILDKAKPVISPVPALFEKMSLKISKASAVVFGTYQVLNSIAVTEYLKSQICNAVFVGFLTLEEVPLPPASPSSADHTGCLAWLDQQAEASVVYISFGSIVALPGEEMVELAEAIEESRVAFLWSLADKLKDHLPDGFLERTSKRGQVVPWAPQKQVLAHPSTRVHVTHGGYHAVCESIVAAVPMICRSVWADNHLNARAVEEEWEIGVRVKGCVISRNGMLESLKIFEEREKKLRDSIMKLKKLVLEAAQPDGAAAMALKTLVQIISAEL